MSWQTWTKISGVILFILAVAGFYLGNFYNEGVILSIEDFPQHLDSLETTEDIQFSFYLYNSGEETAFVKSIILLRNYEDGSQVADAIEINPQSDFVIAAGESTQITVILPAQENPYSLTAEIFYDDTKLISETIPVVWGTLL